MVEESGTIESDKQEESRFLIRQVVREATEALDRAPPIPKEIAGYRILGLLGKGGMGIVYRAEQQSPKRIIALKVVASESLTKEKVRRFTFEAEFLGRLQHPGIARIYEAGVTETPQGRRPYLALELIADARSITCYAREEELTTRQCLELVAEVCDAIEHAHQQGVIHRDLKPANILVDMNGQPKILDFGVARATDSDIQVTTLATNVNRFIGTIPYMSPEQASGNSENIDTRSDLFAIGVVAYQLLTNRMPHSFDELTYAQMLQTICEDTPSRISSIDRALRGDIETIVLKALEKDRERRYQSAAAFAYDIRRFLSDQTILARPPSSLYQFRKFARRNKTLVTGVAGVILSLVLGIVGMSWQAAQTTREAEASLQNLRLFLSSGAIISTKWAADPANADILHKLSESAGRLFRDEPEYEAHLRDMFGFAFIQLEEADYAETEYRKYLTLCRQIHGPKNEKTLRAYDLLIDALLLADKLEEAEDLVNKSLIVAGYGEGVVQNATTELTSYTHALRTLRLRYKLAVTLHDLGRLDASDRIYRKTLDELRSVLSLVPVSFDNHENVAEVRWSLTRLLIDQQGQMQEAIDLMHHIVLYFSRFNNASLSNTLAIGTLAKTLYKSGQTEQALNELNRADQLSLKLKPSERITTAIRLGLIRAKIIMETDADTAEPLLLEALIYQEERKPKHWRTALVRISYAQCLVQLKQYEKAAHQLDSAHNVLLRRFGKEDYRVRRLEEFQQELHQIETEG